MPCYSNLKTVLIALKDIETAAKALGITIEKHTANRFTLKKGSEHITIERAKEGEPFFTKAYSGSSYWETEIMQPLVQVYAKERLKAFATKNGYTLSAGNKESAYVLTTFK